MDLSTIATNLKTGKYANRQAFANDFNQIVKNAYLYNPEGTPPHQAARDLEELFKKCELAKDTYTCFD